ncbi:MAG: glucose-1-phosphate adenylyltransferase [Cyanobacteria bacterium]|nr:glucose-1-phosphate adenylyltransferase [Cyanobacteriota bacterium]
MKKVLAIILGGGAGTRLYPLTKTRAKPAGPLAGKHRLIDIPISNCINSEILKICVLTQFNSASLNQHIGRAYGLSGFQQGFVEVLAAQQTPANLDWFQGTADAVRQHLKYFESLDVDEYLILPGDHLYRMDYRDLIQRHRATHADVTLSVLPVDEQQAAGLGLMQINPYTSRIIHFSEKPEGEALRKMQVDTSALGLSPEQARGKPYIASMGIYVFKRAVLIDLLRKCIGCTDFGKEIIPIAIDHFNVQAYLFDGYWEDIGTIQSFFRANLALAKQPNPLFSFYDVEAPIYTRSRHLPPTKHLACQIEESMVSEGCMLKKCQIFNSVIGIRTRIESGCTIRDSLIMGADYYQPDFERRSTCNHSIVPLGIGANSEIQNAIVDKNAHVGCNVKILNGNRIEEADREAAGFFIRSGVVVVLKDATLPDGMVI